MQPREIYLRDLRQEIKREGAQGLLIPHADCFQSENLGERDQHLWWLTGFTGSAGLLIVLPSVAALFVDGRYTLQAMQQVQTQEYSVEPYSVKNIVHWLRHHSQKEDIILYDPWLHTAHQIKNYERKITEAGLILQPCDRNLVQQVWTDPPKESQKPFKVHPLKWTGKSSKEKIKQIAQTIKDQNCTQLVITDPCSLAWLLNLRGEDVPYTPDCRAFAILDHSAAVKVFTDLRKVTEEVKTACGKEVLWYDFGQFSKFLEQTAGQCVMMDPLQVPQKVFIELSKAKASLLERSDPCLLARALKNSCEQEGARTAHQRDGVAMVHFLAWLSEQGQDQRVSEIGACEYLHQQRRAQPYFQGESFPTISGVGPHGAIVHYTPTPETNAYLGPNSIYLVDSGGQYYDGTTDVTRTIVFGIPTAEQKDRFTRVLKGHIALADIRFPKETTGHQLDVLARQYLWQVGLDYEHSTGHGVGSYLAVHEGPHRIGKTMNPIPLQIGMIVSNEPGYYKSGEYGIRLENLMLVVPAMEKGAEDTLRFETLTLVPIDRNLIEVGMLTLLEREWLNTYHKHVFEKLSPFLSGSVLDWLRCATQPIG